MSEPSNLENHDTVSCPGTLELLVSAHPFLFLALVGASGAGLVSAIWEVTLRWL